MSSDEKSADSMKLDDVEETLQIDKIAVEYKWKICNFDEHALSQTFASCEKLLPRNLGKFKTTIFKKYSYGTYVKLHTDFNVESIPSIYYMQSGVELYDSSGKVLISLATKYVPEQDKNKRDEIMINGVDLRDKLKDDILIIKTTVTQCYIKSTYQFDTIKKNSLTNDISHLLQSKDFSDVTIKIDDKVYNLHKNILASRSKVFKAMLTTKMKEQEINEIVIKEMAPEVFEKLLFYIYNDRMSDASDGSLELCNAANMYEILDLQKLCEIEMEKNISCENVLAIFNYADSMNHEDLKEKTVEFILRNSTALSASDLKFLHSNQTFFELLFKRCRL